MLEFIGTLFFIIFTIGAPLLVVAECLEEGVEKEVRKKLGDKTYEFRYVRKTLDRFDNHGDLIGFTTLGSFVFLILVIVQTLISDDSFFHSLLEVAEYGWYFAMIPGSVVVYNLVKIVIVDRIIINSKLNK